MIHAILNLRVTDGECQIAGADPNSELCARGVFIDGACFGDSGGPLVRKGAFAKDDVVIGIVQHEWTCGTFPFGDPVVYSRIADSSFIRNALDGTFPPACPAGTTNIRLVIYEDDWPEDNSWELEDSSGTIIASANCPASDPLQSVCLNDREHYTFTMFDSFGDGT